MRVGIVSNWCNRGQAVVSRYIRKIFHEAGHETFVLAKPTNPKSPIGNFIDESDVWDVPNLTRATEFEIKKREYLDWVEKTGIEVVFNDMNMQFREIKAVREAGVKTIGRFVWERLDVGHVERVKKAYDVVYSLTRCEQERYAQEFGIDSPYVRFGVFPDLPPAAPKRDDAVYFLFHGGLQGPRKPLKITVDAFRAVDNPNIRLILKSQGVRDNSEEFDFDDDPRIRHIVEDMPYEAYHALLTSCHVCLAPSRWEGLGVHLYEALGHGIPTISNDIPPINEVITHGVSGLLARSHPIGNRPNGLPIYDPDPDHLRELIEELSDPARVADLARTTAEDAHRFAFDQMRHDYLALAEA